MTARAEALRLLVDVERGGFSDRLLAARAPRLRDPRDRHFLHALVLAVLRWQGALDAVLEPRVHGGLAALDPPVRAALRLGLVQRAVLEIPGPIAVDATIEALKRVAGPRAAGLVNAVLRRATARTAPLAVNDTLPGWLLARWSAAFGADAATALAQAALVPSHPFAVARADRGGAEGVAAALDTEGVSTRSSARIADGLEVVAGAPQATRAFANGDFSLLDEGAALVARLAAPADDRPVADLAAAPGGKSVLIAQTARVASLEPVASRCAALAAALARRAPAGRAAAVRGDALSPPLRAGAFGTVLLDAPCSGTGTFRRRPEKKWRLRPDDIADCAARQARMLEAAAALPGAGGVLVYAVCSLEPEEGRERVLAFLAGHPEFRPQDPREILGPAGDGLVDGDPPLLVTRPDRHGTDGFVAVRLVRRG